jgi:hypothetical protein
MGGLVPYCGGDNRMHYIDHCEWMFDSRAFPMVAAFRESPGNIPAQELRVFRIDK